jgi:peptide/nickel transport system ATP-binding protein
MADSGGNGKQQKLLEVKNLKMYFPITQGIIWQRKVGDVRAVDDVDFYIRRGETLGLVGESGCGKTTLGRCVIRAYEPTSGQVFFDFGDDGGELTEVTALEKRALRMRRRYMQMIFQDPYSSLNPRKTLKQIVGEPLVAHRLAAGSELDERVAHLLEIVGLRPEYMSRYPHAFSGGQRQRIGIARALALNPQFIVCDEPVSALDVSVQAQILNLLQDLQEELSLTYLFVAHNLSVVKHISDRVAVMYVGKLVEQAETEALFANPMHPYTEALISAVPKPDPLLRSDRVVLPGEVANPANPPSGCYFHPRCRYAEPVCSAETPLLQDVGNGHRVACHRARELQLSGLESRT